jgi:hypothetical protein
VALAWTAALLGGCAGGKGDAPVAAPIVSAAAFAPGPAVDASLDLVDAAGNPGTDAALVTVVDGGPASVFATAGGSDAATEASAPASWSRPAFPPPPGPTPGRVPTRGTAAVGARANECYRLGVAADPAMSGELVVDIKLQQDGAVEWAKVKAISGVSDEVAQCITHAIMTVAFDPSPMGAIILELPLKFVNPSLRR